MIARLRRRRSRRADTGASAVEFALVAPVLFLVLFGIIDYGIWFADSISARQAVRDGARRGVVENFTGCDTPVAGADLANLACSIKEATEPIGARTYVRIEVAASPAADAQVDGGPPANWTTQNATLRVCVLTQHDSLLPLVPVPNDGISVTQVDMPIEQAIGANANSRGTYSDPVPAPADWTWCK
jgi:Flp pilus assembly protein TadG